MRITFLGNFGVSFSTESHHLWTYRKLGHEVIPLQEGRVTAGEVYDEAKKSDLFVWTHTHGWNTPGMVAVLKNLRDSGIPSAGYHLDLWKGIKREADLSKDEYWNIEYFFTVDKNFIPDLKKRGIKAFYLPAGVVESECYLAEPDRERFPHDVIFVGSKNYHPEWPYRPKLINWLHETYGDKFGHYGGDGLGVVRGHDLNVLYASAKVVVGDTLSTNYKYPHYFSDRLFETTGRGGMLVFPYILGLEDHFVLPGLDNKDQVEVVAYEFNKFWELRFMIDQLLTRDEERETIRMNGHERTKKDHTYTQRLTRLLKTVFRNYD